MSDERKRPGDGEVGPTAERVERYRSGDMSAAEQAGFEREILADPALAELVYEEGVVDGLLGAAREARARRSRFRPRRVWVPLALAATVLGVIVVLRSVGPEETQPVLRDGGSPFVTVEPSGPVSGDPVRFRWTSDAGAGSYRLEWRDEAGRVVGARETADTTLMVPVAELPDGLASWRVVPIDAAGRERPPTPSAPLLP